MAETVDDATFVVRKTLPSRFWPRSRLRFWNPFRRAAMTMTDELTDGDLRDIGAKPHDIGRMVDRDMARFHARNLRGH